MIDPLTIAVERTIDAPPEAVFRVLDDLDRYPEWNPFTVRVLTSKRVGDPVELHVDMPGRGRMVMRETMRRYDAGRAMAWGVRWLGGVGLRCDRVQEVVPLASGKTSYRCHESFRGALAPLVVVLFGSSMKRGFEANADALKNRVERS